ncbi:hypothetical protein WICMUC_000527 [Wickerhamomyces mucosus]|uniref:TauD/TfdA-like domain-containing protein n=1 Tax=Wickerhamomyces mucosus TaxID=1378264 RepID=A0A9P8PXF1_9ASCO|nr:hypothetical protein WICMUC_000527 [Wickerhamomyces mucosus]
MPAATQSSEVIDSTINQKDDLITTINVDVSKRVAGGFAINFADKLPESTRKRFEKNGYDLSKGYPQKPPSADIPLYLDDALKIRGTPREDFVIRGRDADPEFKALFAKVKEVKHLTKYIGTELVGIQLGELNEKELDELARLIAERVVVFFRDQDLSPQKQVELAHFFGVAETHPQALYSTDEPILRVIWSELPKPKGVIGTFKNAKTTDTANWHADLAFETNAPGITHLHIDSSPEIGGDTLWSSGYAAYDKLSPALQKFLEGKYVWQKSLHAYLDRNDPLSGPKPIERKTPLVRTHPVTGWKSLFINRGSTLRIEGLEPEESRLILNYLSDIYEKNLDIQVRFNWGSNNGSGTSALWDNRISQHSNVHDLVDANGGNRHGTRTVSFAEIPYFDSNSKSQREALGLGN